MVAEEQNALKEKDKRRQNNTKSDQRLKRNDVPNTPTGPSGQKGRTDHNNMVKSPSDTTIYAPAFGALINLPVQNQQIFGNAVSQSHCHKLDKNMDLVPSAPFAPSIGDSKLGNEGTDFVMQIIKFIEGIRTGDRDHSNKQQDSFPEKTTPQGRSDVDQSRINAARRKANDSIIEAERFKAAVNNPPGIEHNPVNLALEQHLDIDDQFFHVTCHLDEGLKGKIERGEYVELEKLLPKHIVKTNTMKTGWT